MTEHRASLGSDPRSEDLVRFYAQSYSQSNADAELYSRWRALGARGKADHVIALCTRMAIRPSTTLEIGCGDGALLSELRRRGFGGRLTGVEITERAVAIARGRAEIDEVALYDGERLPFADASFELAILSHVLEHVPRPDELLAEAARAARVVVVEVPLEHNFSARRTGKRAHAAEVGHLQRLDRRGARALARAGGLQIAGELEDPLPLSVLRFFARGRRQRALASAKWALRTASHRAAPGLARRLFTVHYACLCVSPSAASD